MDDVSGLRQFREWLPFYVNGTLDEPRQKAMAAYVAAYPAAREECAFAERMAQAARLHGEQRDPLAGYAQLQARMAASRPPPLSPLARLRQLLSSWGLSPAMALTLVFASAQLALTGSLLLPAREQVTTRGLAAPQQRAQIKLVVKRGANYGELVALLTRQGCHIVWGPTVSGELWLALDEPRHSARVREVLAQSPLVEDVLELAPA